MKLDRVKDRATLKPRRDPYWHRLAEGRHVGFRRMTAASEGTWLARAYTGDAYKYHPLTDFAALPDKDRFDAARKAAEDWFRHLDLGGSTERVTVRKACENYVAHLLVEKSKGSADDAAGRFERLVYSDPLAAIELQKLGPAHVRDWRTRVRERGGSPASFNRNATALRAALNLAYSRRDVASDHAWVEVLEPVKGADRRRELYLKSAARQKLLEKASVEAKRFVQVLLLLPLRPGDVAKLKVEDFDAHHGTIAIPDGKTDRRVIPLPREAVAHFKACAKDKLPGAWLVARDSGQQWRKETWRDAIKEAATAAKLPTGTVAYTLRHCAITDLVVQGLDLFTVAKLSGTSVAMIERHYGHLQREHARAALSKLAKA